MSSSLTRRPLLVIAFILSLSLVVVPFFEGFGLTAHAAEKLKKPSSVKVIKNNKSRTITITWKKPSKKSKVQVFLKKGEGKYKRVKTTGKSKFTIKELKYGVKYKIKIRSKKGKSYSKFAVYKKSIVLKAPAKAPSQKTPVQTPEPQSPTINDDGGVTIEEADPPAAMSFETTTGYNWYGSYKFHYLILDGTEQVLSQYFDNISKVTVGGFEYSKLNDHEYLSDASGDKWKRYDGAYGRDYFLGLTSGNGFDENGTTTILVEATGFKPLTIQIGEEGDVIH